MQIGKLYIVATPIGNLQDITLRALETLRTVDLILCEDTRVTQNLLNKFEIKTPTLSYHHHSTESKINEIIKLLEEGKNLALVTDAGTPGISDPGNELISKIANSKEQIAIEPIPGPSAVIAALSISGFPTDKFLFLGFPPHKKGRNGFFKKVEESEYTVVFYESCYRIKKCIDELTTLLDAKRKICLCRELTKKFETVYRGSPEEIKNLKIMEKGEFVVVVNGKR